MRLPKLPTAAQIFDFLAGDTEREQRRASNVVLESWEVGGDLSGMVGKPWPPVFGPPTKPDMRTEQQRVEDAGWEAYANMVERGEITG